MELKWLEDFVSLAETRSFSRSAELRHVSQPAFSRRIQALEAWLATELIDRSVYPTRLTQAGQVFYEQALAMLSQAHEARTLLRGHVARPCRRSSSRCRTRCRSRIFRAGCSGSRRKWGRSIRGCAR